MLKTNLHFTWVNPHNQNSACSSINYISYFYKSPWHSLSRGRGRLAAPCCWAPTPCPRSPERIPPTDTCVQLVSGLDTTLQGTQYQQNYSSRIDNLWRNQLESTKIYSRSLLLEYIDERADWELSLVWHKVWTMNDGTEQDRLGYEQWQSGWDGAGLKDCHYSSFTVWDSRLRNHIHRVVFQAMAYCLILKQFHYPGMDGLTCYREGTWQHRIHPLPPQSVTWENCGPYSVPPPVSPG